jgi:hypothetical protein
MGEVRNVPVSDGAKLFAAFRGPGTMAVSAVQFFHPGEAGILAVAVSSRSRLLSPLDRIMRSVVIDVETADLEPPVPVGGLHQLAVIVTER